MEPRGDDSVAQFRGAVTTPALRRNSLESQPQSLGRRRSESTHEHLVRPAERRILAARAVSLWRDRVRRVKSWCMKEISEMRIATMTMAVLVVFGIPAAAQTPIRTTAASCSALQQLQVSGVVL